MQTVIFVEEVFTPTVPAKLTFVERVKVNDRLVDALKTPGKQIIIYGHSGCGKTTLLEHKLNETYAFHYTSRCTADVTMQSLVLEALVDLGVMATTELEEKVLRRSGGEITVGRGAAKASLSTANENESKSKKSLVASITPSIRTLARALGERNGCWVLEDFHKMPRTEKVLLAQSMKMFMDMASEYPDMRLIAIGAVDTARQVVDYDTEMKNRVSEIEVPLMTSDELHEIISKGESLLNTQFDHRVKNGFVALSNGLASACHQLCLNLCRGENLTQNSSHRRVINYSIPSYRKAIERYVEEASDSLKADFDKATKQIRSGKFSNGNLILQSLLKFGADGATHAQILLKIREKESKYPASNLTTYLERLQQEENGALLRFDEDSNRYSFKEPVGRAYAHTLYEKNDMVSQSNADTVSNRISELVTELLALTQKAREPS